VQVVPDSRWNDLARQKVIDGLRARMGDNLRVALRVVEDLPAEASGKYRYVVSHVRMEKELQQACGQTPASEAQRESSQ
jgi:phenylacetate-CoA ligase